MLRIALPIVASLSLAGCIAVNVSEKQTTGRTAEARPVFDRVDDAASPIPAHQRQSDWFRDARQRVYDAQAGGGARNVVLFVGDGMGISTITAARILDGQRAGNSGEENRLSFESFPITGLIKTYNVDSQTPDSAGTMSAMVTGVKTDIRVFGVDEQVQAGDCASMAGRELISLLEIAELAGVATGIVSTARLTHATPGATYAKTVHRDWEDDDDLPEAARNQGCTDIASQFVAHHETLNTQFGDGISDGIDVALGGGRRHFLPESIDGGLRTDGRDLISEWRLANPEGTYVADAQSLDQVRDGPLLGLFSKSHMAYASQRRAPDAEQPSLKAMTMKAMDVLERGSNGYFLMVEAGRIDHAHHAGNAFNALNDTIELSETVQAVADRVNSRDTLILVTADHSHVFTMAGYPRRGNPILGKVIPAWSDEPLLDADGNPYTTLGYMNGRGFRDYGEELNADRTYADPPVVGRQDIRRVNTQRPGYHQEALVPLSDETHGGEDVAVYARGPGARAASGVNEQNLLFHVMLSATNWETRAAQRVTARR